MQAENLNQQDVIAHPIPHVRVRAHHFRADDRECLAHFGLVYPVPDHGLDDVEYRLCAALVLRNHLHDDRPYYLPVQQLLQRFRLAELCYLLRYLQDLLKALPVATHDDAYVHDVLRRVDVAERVVACLVQGTAYYQVRVVIYYVHQRLKLLRR